MLPPSFRVLEVDDPLSCSQFGDPGTQYDWGGKSINDLDHKVKELEETQRGMKKKVNPKVMNMIDKWGFFLFAAFGILIESYKG